MMQYTSAQANNLLKQLEAEQSALEVMESENCKFIAATVEDLEQARPPYDYGETQKQFAELERKICMVKHAINVFNTTHLVPGFDLTVDQMLVHLNHLKARQRRLSKMAICIERTRRDNYTSKFIEYVYANFDVKTAKADFLAVVDEIGRARIALDTLNNSETMEIAIEN